MPSISSLMGARLFTLHPLGLPAVQVRVIEYCIEPCTVERLAQFLSSQTANRADPRQVHRLVTTLLDPQHAPALELILCSHERWEIEACIDEQKTHLRLSGQPIVARNLLECGRNSTVCSWRITGVALVYASTRL